MTGSVGAATAAMPGRGNRAIASDNEYQVVLPTLPTGRLVLNTVFLHGDISARPYRAEDFRDALAPLSLLPEVIALGAYRMSHVWAVTFKDADAAKKIVNIGELKVKNARCLVIDPANRDVRMKLHWLLHSVPDEDVRLAFSPFGKVTDVSRELWRAQGVSDKGSTTRMVTLKLNAGVKLDDLPHQVNVAGELALVVVSGRPPLCLRCRGTGHIRRDCQIPRCGSCRRFGHDEGHCARTYSRVAGPVSSDETSALLMDEADAEEASKEASGPAVQETTSAAPRAHQLDAQAKDRASPGQTPLPPAQDAVAASKNAAETPDASSENATQPVAEPMDLSPEGSSHMAGKRSHDEAVSKASQPDEIGGDEPPFKAAGMRRASWKLRPNIPAESRQAGKPPP
ncbi:uncharacterized protein LOC142578464 [Dermacentor variabilis]|uniref:uncharacterized protein LOC142578464 n=1 Tax=Dermacentor variabilis TaxID=34621 RepID=UPI003F5C6BB1